ncbi:cytochrome c3 family protein, partial [Acinetobacter baumannii]
PGPLSKGHAKYEKECQSCHEPFVRHSQSGLCLTCHKDISADRKTARGFHGRQPDASKSDCRTCHAEHKGRDADILQLNRQLFNHASTNFPLLGGHKR